MLRKWFIVTICIFLALSVFIGCQSQSSGAAVQESGATGKTETSGTSGSDIVGKITAIDGDQITLALGTLGQGERTQNSGDGKPGSSADSGATSSATAEDGGQHDNPPKGDASGGEQNEGGQQPPSVSGVPKGGNGASGGQGGGPGGMGGGTFTESGEEMTITVTDNTVITLAAMGGPGGQDGALEQNGAAQSSAETTSGTAENGGSEHQKALDSGTLSDLAVGDIVIVTLSGETATAISVMPSGNGGLGGSPGGRPEGDDRNGQQDGSEQNGKTSESAVPSETAAADESFEALSNTSHNPSMASIILGIEFGTLAQAV